MSHLRRFECLSTGFDVCTGNRIGKYAIFIRTYVLKSEDAVGGLNDGT